MKRIVSIMLVLLLALTSVAAVNAQGIIDISGSDAPRGTATVINDNHGVTVDVIDYSGRNYTYRSGEIRQMNGEMSHSLTENGVPKYLYDSIEAAVNAQKLWDTSSANDLSYIVVKDHDVGSFLLYDSDTNRYHIDSWNADGYAQKVTYDSTTKKFSYEDYYCNANPTLDPYVENTARGNIQEFLNDSFGFYYALSVKTNFIMPEGGNLVYTDGNNVQHTDPMRFEFSGDDMILVYIDGVRVLNGSVQNWRLCYRGLAQYPKPSIDFSTGAINTMVNENVVGQTTLYDQFAAYCDEKIADGTMTAAGKTAYLASKFDYDSTTGNYTLKIGPHSFAMFYAETGAEQSNCRLSFNLLSDNSKVVDFVEDIELYEEWIEPTEPTGLTDSVLYYNGNTLLQQTAIPSGATTYSLTANPITTPESGVTGIVDGLPTKAGYLFAGWYTTPQTPGTTTGQMLPQSITIDDYDDANGNLNLYAGWVAKGTVSVDNSDPNKNAYGTASLNGFDLEGIQIKSHLIADEGVDHEEWEGAQYDGLRFITVYRNGMINELESLYASGNLNYVAASDTDVKYGYTMYAKSDIANLEALNGNTDGAVDVDCTRDGNMNHKMFTDYRLATIVVKYEGGDHAYVDDLLEARAYIDYIDANGFARRGYDTYGDAANETMFAGGCRASFSQAQAALTRR